MMFRLKHGIDYTISYHSLPYIYIIYIPSTLYHSCLSNMGWRENMCLSKAKLDFMYHPYGSIGLPSGYVKIAIEAMASIEIVDPSKKKCWWSFFSSLCNSLWKTPIVATSPWDPWPWPNVSAFWDEDVMGLDAPTLHHLWECSEVHQFLGDSAGRNRSQPLDFLRVTLVRWFRFIYK